MTNMDLENTKAQMRKGILEYCILSILSKNSCYASDIIRELKEAKVIVVEGTLYPLLTRQKNSGLLSYRWKNHLRVPRENTMKLTPEGKEYLSELDSSWEELIDSVNMIRKK